MGRLFPPVPALVLLAALGCTSHRFSQGVFAKDGVRYRVGELSRSWRPLEVDSNDVAYASNDSPHSLAVNSTCQPTGDASLEVLTGHLLIGFTDREKVSEEKKPLDGRDSLRSRYKARLDGVPVEMMLVVMKKDGCVYDFTYLSPPGRFDEKRQSFERVLAEFHAEAAP
ncbi:MAG TPA: hypothetical protein VND93_19670 [Myxococcales bacterium]|jgi:hypothetical protein|nr:hypothetical protein [Myxococcales bacterium]